jgi:hypothetical protein
MACGVPIFWHARPSKWCQYFGSFQIVVFKFRIHPSRFIDIKSITHDTLFIDAFLGNKKPHVSRETWGFRSQL